MAQDSLITIFLPGEADTDALGQRLAEHARPGDTILLTGPIGAGKSHLCRAFIRARLGPEEEVPSPTFTLIQTYEDSAGDIWHADLYRLTHPDEVLELGLEDAFTSALCLIEWPDRLGPFVPADPIRLTLRAEGEGRTATIAFSGRPDLRKALRNG